MPQKPATNTRGKSKVSTKWLNNVMKSIGAASVDNFKEIAPNLSELGKGTAGAIRSIKDVTKGNNVSQVSKALSNNSTIKSVKKAFTNSLNDIKTGKIYNNERLTETMEESFGDFDFSDFEDANEDATVTFNYIDDGNRSSSNGSAVIADAIATSAESNIKAQKASVDAMISIASAGMMQSQEIAKETNMHLSNINNGITALVQFQQENTLKFYESAMAVFDRYAKTTEDDDRGKRSNGPDVFNGTRGIDVGKYKEYVKKQIKSVYKNSGAGSTLDMLTDDSMLDMMLANPVGGATKMILSAMVPNLVTNTVKGMEDAFTGFMPTMLAKLGDWRKSEEAGMKGALQRLIGNVFGIKVDAKKGFDLSGKVSKDAAVFDGVTRNSIVEIIPKHLREMSSYLKDIAEHFKIDTNKSKDNGEVFDIESGRYTKVKDVRSDIANQIKEGIEDAFNRSEFGEALRAGGSELVGKDAKTYEKMMSQFFQGLTRYEKAFTPDKMDIHDKNSDVNKIAEYIDVNNKHDEKILNILLNTIDLMKKNQVGVQHAAKAQMDAKVAFNNAIEDLNENYDTRNLLAAGITEDTNPWELVDVETGNKNSQKKRKELEERKKQEQKARDKYQMKHRTKGNAKTLAKKGLQNQDIIPDNETMSGRRQSAVKMADASTIPGMIANAGTHTKNGMFAIMNGDSKGAMKEFAAIFSDSMKTFWGSIKDNFLNPLKESIFGKKDENGYKQGGMFSAIQNKSKDIWHEMGSKIKGTDWTDADGNVHKGDKENSVLGKVSSVFKELGESVRYRLFGDKDKDGEGAEKKTGVIGGLVESLKLGLQGWKTTLFGSDDPEKSEKDMVEDFKKKAMDAIPTLGVGALAGLGTSLLSGGLLGAIVGGPMTGIVLGMGTSLVARSDKFKDYLFGPEVEDENGNKSRIGGLISKKTQEMFKDPKLKKSVIGGAALGMAKNLILGSSGGFMGALVGGPFAGAILGSAVGFMKESQMFKDFMYGNEEKGIEGFKSKLSNNIKKAFGHKDDEDTKDFKKRMGMGVIGAGTGGLLGFMAGGPIVGALAGLALGVKSSGKKFNKWLFGEKDENGEKIKEGMVGKVGNWMHVEVFAPMKTKFLGIADDFKNTMKNKVFAKLSVMVEPLVSAFKGLTEKIKEGTKKAGGLLKKIMSPITNLAKKIVFDPLKKVVSGVTSLAYKSAKSMITFPVKILEVATRWVTSPFRKAAKKIGEAVDNVKEFTKKTIKKAYSKTFGKLVNLVKAGFSWGKDKAKEKVTNTGYKLIDTISGGRIKGKEGLNNLKKKLGFGGVGTALTDADIDYLKEKQENKKVQRDRKAMDKNRALAAKTLGYDVKYFDEKTMNAAIEKNKALKHKFKKNSAGEIGFEKDPKQVAAEMKQKAAETVQKLSDDDMLNAKSSDLDIQGRQLQQQTRSASLLERLVSFFTGDKPAFGVGKMNQSGKSDSDAKKDKKDSENKDNENEDEDEKSGAISKIDELKQKFEEAGGFFNYIKGKASETFANFKEKSKTAIDKVKGFFNRKGKASETFANFKEKSKTAIDKVKGFFNRKGKARANGGDVDDGESYLVGDGGSDPKAAEIFTPKAKGKILSQKGNGIKVFVQGIASSVISKLKGTDGPSVDGATPNFGGGINGIKGRLKNFGMGIPFAGGSNNSSEDDSEADDIAVMKTKANSDADYDEEGNLIKENADTSDVDDIKDSSAKKEAIIDADNAVDLANAKNEGSFESQQKKKEAEKEGEKDKEYKGLFGAIKDKIGEGNEQSKSHFLSWDNIFSKKGLITAGLLVLMAKFPGIWNTLKDIISSIADGIGTAIGLTVKENNVNNGIGSQTDGGSRTDEAKKKIKDIKDGNIIHLNEDGSTTSGTHEAVNLIGKTIINWQNRYNSSFTKKTRKTKKLMRGVEKVIKAPGRALDYVVNGPASDYKKFTRDKKKNHLKYDKKTGIYTDGYGRTVIDKDDWAKMVEEKGEDWAENAKENFFVPGDDSFELKPKTNSAKKEKGKFGKWKDKKKKDKKKKDKKKKEIEEKVKNSKAGQAYDKAKTKVTDVKNKSVEKVKNSKAGQAYDKAKTKVDNAKAKVENAKTKARNKVEDFRSKSVEKVKNSKPGKAYDKAKTKVDNMKKKGQEFIENTKEKGKKVVNDGLDKLKQHGKDAASKLSERAKKNKGEGGLFKKIAGYVEGFFSSLISKLSEKSGKSGGGIKKALSKFSPKNIMNALKGRFPKIAGKLSGIMTRGITIGTATLGVSELVFAVGGAIDGATCAAKLFKVSKADVDWTMRLIGAAWGLVAGTTAGAIVDCILDFLEPWNVRVGLLSALYSFFAGDEKADNLKKSQDKFIKTYEADTGKKIKEQWETQKKAGIIGKDVSYEEFQEGVKEGKYKIDQESIEDYNTRVNAGLSDKVTGAVTKGVGYVYHRGKDFLVGKESYQDDKGNTYSKNDDGSWQVTDKSGKDLGSVNKDAIDTSKMKDTSSKGVIGKAKDLVGGAVSGLKNFFMDSKEEIFRASDGTYYNAKGECFSGNDERLKNQDISPKELQARIKAGTLIKTEKVKKSGIKNLASKAWNGLTGGIKKGWNALKNFGTSVRDKAMDMGKTFVNGVKNAAEKTKNFFMDSKESVFAAADGTYYNAKGECFNKNDERLKNQDISPKELQARIKAGTLVKKEKVKKSGIKNLASKAWNGLTSGIKKGWEGLKSFAGGVKEKFGELKDGFVKFAKDPLGSVKSFFTSSKKQGYMSPEGDYYILNDDKTWTHYSATGGVLEDKIKDKEKIKEINSKIKNGTLIQTEITDKSGLQKIGEKFQNAVSKGWDKIKDGASSLWSGITNFFGGGGEEVSNTAAKVTKQTAAIVPPGVKDADKKSMANQKKTGGNGENEDDENGGNGEEVNGFSYFSQKDKKWSGNKYGSKDGKHSSSFGKSGCGPTAFAMVANQLKGGKIDPTTIADDAIKSGYRDETGTNANFIDYESQKYGLDTTQQDTPSAEYIIGQMDKGRPMILNGITSGSKDSAYTKSGHYVVAVGRDKNGNILINDPRGKSKSVPISPEDLAKETRIGWTFESPGYTIKKITKRIGGHGDKNTFTAEDVINIAKGEVGYSEKASNSKLDDKKANAGKKNFTKYARDVGHANGLAWCATFVTWCFVKAANGDKKKAKEVLCGANTAGCSNNVNAFKKAGRYDMKPQPGDVVFFMNGSSHTGLVIAVKGNTITTIEGNTSPGKFNRDGGCVAQKTYNYKTYHRISGFGHPKYDGTSTFNGEVGTADSSSNSDSTTTESNSDNAITSFSDKFTNLFTQFSEKAMNGITTGKWDYNFNADGNTTSDTSGNSDGSASSSEATSDGKVDLTITGKNKSEKVWNFFKNNGFSDAATAGILGNMYQESGVNPESIQGGGKGPAAGIFQWENYNDKSLRFGNLYKRAKKRGKDWKDLATQLEFGLDEMKTKDMNNRFSGKTGYLEHNPWTTTDIDKKQYSVKPVKGGFEGYKQMSDATEAVKTFEAAFERAGKPNFKRRIQYAKTMMNKYGGKTGGNGEGDETDTYLNETSERYFNPQYKKTNTFDVDRTVHVNTTNKSGNNIMNVIDTKKLEEILEKAVSVLESIDKSTSSSQKELQSLRNASNNQMNNITNNNIYNTSNQSGTTATGKNINDRNSKLAAMLARG